jgi:CubicO group peptidase (beta-lactamase class C family)
MKTILLILAFPLSLQAQQKYQAQLDSYIRSAVDINQFNGCVLVAQSGKIIYQSPFGYTDFASTRLLTNNSLFDIGKVTEQFTAAGILLLEEKKKLKLTDPITTYYPELPYNNITLHHLLTHTSGLPDYYELMKGKWGTDRLATNADMIKYLADAKTPLLFKPGQKYEHCFTGFPLLASVIEKVSGLGYAEFMQKNFFNPLKMNHTRVLSLLHSQKKNYPGHTEGVPFYEPEQEFTPADSIRQFPSEMWFISEGILGGTGISSTTGDLFLWDRSFKNNKLLNLITQNKMLCDHVLIDSASKIFMGYGFWSGDNELGKYIQYYDGGNNATLGFSASLTRYIKQDLTIIVLTNKTKSSSLITGALSYILFNREVSPLYVHKETQIDSSVLVKYAGRYLSPNTIELINKNGALFRHWPWTGEPDLEFRPESSTKFFSISKEYDHQLEFIMNAKGNMIKAYYIVNGIKKEIKKTD